jgi:large subunit ribosomal protein L4
MKVDLIKKDGKTSQIDLNIKDHSELNETHEALLARVLNQNKKQGTKLAKGRSEVRGRAAKPFRQKGTGNARQGSRKAPHMRGGGVAHGPKQDFTKLKLNKKFKKASLRGFLTEKIQMGSLKLVDMDKKTRNLVRPKSLFVYSKENKELARIYRNIADIKTIEFNSLSSLSALQYSNIYFDSSLKEKLEGILK